MGEFLTGSAVTLGTVAAIITSLAIIWVKAVKPAWRRFWGGLRMVQRVTKALDWMLPFEEHWRKLDQRLSDVAQLVEARHGEMTARLAVIEKHVESTQPVAVTISDGPVPVKIVEDQP